MYTQRGHSLSFDFPKYNIIERRHKISNNVAF